MLPTNNISTNYEARGWRGGGGGGWKDGTSTGLTSPKMRGLDRDRGGGYLIF